MFTKNSNATNNKITELTRYFEGTDIQNSLLFKELPKLKPTGTYTIHTQRYDVISEDLYQTPHYDWALMIYVGAQEEDLVPGSQINYPSLSSINSLIMKMK